MSADRARPAELSQPSGSVHPAVRRRGRRRYHLAAGGGEARRQARAAVRGGKSAGAGRHRGGALGAVPGARRLHARPRHQRHLDQRRHLQGAAVRSGEGSFATISTIGSFDLVFATNAESEFKTLQDFIKAAREQPGKLNVGTINVGGTQNLAAELFKSLAGINFQIVPYRGTPDVIVALLRNDVQMLVEFYAPIKSTLLDNKIRAVATSGTERSPFFADVPTVAEAGVAGYEVTSWNGLFAPVGTPAEIIDLLNKTVREIVATPEVKQRYADLGIEAQASTPEQLKARLADDIAKWAAVIERAGIPKQ